jgi:hypothetical protein
MAYFQKLELLYFKCKFFRYMLVGFLFSSGFIIFGLLKSITMKNSILFFCFLVLSSSAISQVKNTIYPAEKVYAFNFTPFIQKGFLMTPEKYSGIYEPVGIINYESIPGAEFKLVERLVTDRAYGINDQPVTKKVYDWVIDSIPIQSILTKFYNECVKLGADALVNFEYEFFSNSFGVVHGFDSPFTIYGIRMSGFAIKRKDK